MALTSSSFPLMIVIGPWKIRAHFIIETLAYLIGFRLFLWLRGKKSDVLGAADRFYIVTAAITGAAIGSHFLACLETGSALWNAGKTIVGGLIGGLIFVEALKKAMGISIPTGDLFAIPISLGIAIGRLGCFFEGLNDHTYGTPTSLPWGIDFGDGIRRHPTQLYEILWLGILTFWLIRLKKKPHREGDIFKAFMVGYLGWRLLIDFLKPGIAWIGLTAIQWTCLAVLVYYASDVPYIFGLKQEITHA